MFFDTHVHFSVGNTVTLDTSALERAWESGVRRLIATGGDPRANAHAVELARMHPEQVQDFTPTPMTLSTAMFYLGFDPYTGKKVYVARDIEEKRRQKGYFFKK